MSFLKTASRKLHRGQEKVLLKLGIAELLKDPTYEEHLGNFNKLQNQTNRMFIEAQGFLVALQNLSRASASFLDSFKLAYEKEWGKQDAFISLSDKLQNNFSEMLQELDDQIVQPLSSYIEQFPEVKGRIAKRDRKLLDYERAKRAQEVDKEKTKKTQLDAAQKEAEQIFIAINDELSDLLPSFYLGRISFYGSLFQNYFHLSDNFHHKCSKTYGELEQLLDEVVDLQAMAPPRTRKTSHSAENSETASLHSNHRESFMLADGDMHIIPDAYGNVVMNGHSRDSRLVQLEDTPTHPSSPPRPSLDMTPSSTRTLTMHSSTSTLKSHPLDALPTGPIVASTPLYCPSTNPLAPSKDLPFSTPLHTPSKLSEPLNCHSFLLPSPPLDPLLSTPSSSTTTALTAINQQLIRTSRPLDLTVIERRVATHPYRAQDEDELNFVRGDMIEVLPYPVPEEQDEGWFFGRLPNGIMGVFPANFTKIYEAPHS